MPGKSTGQRTKTRDLRLVAFILFPKNFTSEKDFSLSLSSESLN